MANLKCILLAEDDDNDAALTLSALESHSVANDVIHVKDGAEALDYLYARGAYQDRRRGNPAVVLLDLKMPKVDGIDVCRAIKGDLALKMIPVVMLTSSREERDMLRSYECGVNGYVVKPVNFDDFMQTVQQIGAYWAVINEPPPAPDQRS
jgi:CheY-like chemotaxis protein